MKQKIKTLTQETLPYLLKTHLFPALLCFFSSFSLPFHFYSNLSHAKKAPSLRPTIKVGEAQLKKSKLAIFPPLYKGKTLHPYNIKLGKTLFQTIHNNLTISSLFEVIEEKNISKLFEFIDPLYSSYPPPLSEVPHKKLLKKKIDFLAQGTFSTNPDEIILKMFFYSTFHKKILFSRSYKAALRLNRNIGHAFSNDIIQTLTGKPSFFETKIVATRWTKKEKYKKEIFAMDWDGKNLTQISNHNSISISPTWSPDANFIAYTSFLFHRTRKIRNTDLLLHDLRTRKTFILHSGKGLSSGAAFHPDGKSIFFTSSQKGNPDIYKMKFHEALTKNNELKLKVVDRKKKKRKKRIKIKQITYGPYLAMNVEPALSPNGKKIAFSSDRGGFPTIYIIDINGKNLRKLVSVGKYNASPVWSPDGSKIAFSGYTEGHFDLFIIQTDGSKLMRLTSARKSNGKFSNNEDPSFSPDGTRILFTSDRSNHKQLYIIKPNGEDERRITFDEFNYERAKWSPFLRK